MEEIIQIKHVGGFKMKDLALVLYSHSDYSDLWEIAFKKINQFFKIEKKYIFINKINNNQIYDFIPIYYNDNLNYNKRVAECLNKINDKYILFLHEDMILYNQVDIKNLLEKYKFLCENPKFKYFRLIKSGITSCIQIHQNIFEISEQDFCFSITPSIWKKNTLFEICNILPSMNIWNLEINGSEYVKQNKIKGFYWFDNEPKRGQNHFDSNLFPHICSAIFKGKWNMEYKNELNEIFKEFNINPNIRGSIF